MIKFNSSRIMIFGAAGQLGQALRRGLPTARVFDRRAADFTQPERVVELVREIQPQIIFNAAAYTQVDNAEEDIETAMLVNAKMPGVLAEEARKLGAILIHYSTDYVFDGKRGRSYVETDPTNPLNIYGTSKLQGEEHIEQVDGLYLILRTSWVYSLNGKNFVSKVLGWARAHKQLRVVTDQIGSPTWARDLAVASRNLVMQSDFLSKIEDSVGVYHLAGRGQVSRYNFTKKILAFDPHKVDHMAEEVLPAKTEDFPTHAVRPLFSALDCSKFENVFGFQLLEWEVGLKAALEGEKR